MKAILFVIALCLPWQPVMAAERILALAPHVCEILYAIGAQEDIVGAVDYCDYPKAANAIPRVGNYQQVYLEAALRTGATLAIAMDRSVTGIAQLEAHGVRIVQSYPASLEGVIADIRKIGAITGHAEKANLVASGIQRRLDRVRQQQQRQKPVRAFYEIWGDPLITPGKNNFITSLLHEAGARNVFEDVEIDAPRINVESVIRARPDVVVIPTEARDVEQRKRFWQKWLG
ncbi:MAG: helical backbone metal receptor, partial [Mariprofundus sp.]|nr:helical backbone metal receptor [Mariprofundus sp.]